MNLRLVRFFVTGAMAVSFLWQLPAFALLPSADESAHWWFYRTGKCQKLRDETVLQNANRYFDGIPEFVDLRDGAIIARIQKGDWKNGIVYLRRQPKCQDAREILKAIKIYSFELSFAYDNPASSRCVAQYFNENVIRLNLNHDTASKPLSEKCSYKHVQTRTPGLRLFVSPCLHSNGANEPYLSFEKKGDCERNLNNILSKPTDKERLEALRRFVSS